VEPRAANRIDRSAASSGSAGRIYVDRKLAGGTTRREAICALQRHRGNAVYRQLVADAHRGIH